jgi:CBS domain-containing protein
MEVNMKISEIMTPNVEVIHPDARLVEAARKMKSLNVGSLPVCDGDRLKGILTDRDITIRAVAEGEDPNEITVQDVMTPEVVYCFEDQEVEEAARLMGQNQIRRLPILNQHKRLVGILALGDISVDYQNEGTTGKTLEQISEPSRPLRS